MSRIGQIKPYPFPSAQTGDGTVTLASGCVYVLPSGVWFVRCGANIRIEDMDPISQQWLPIEGGALGGGPVSADGCNVRIHNITGTVTINLTAAGSGGTNGIGFAATGVAVAIAASPSGLPGSNATAYAVVGGSVAAPTVTQPGSGFVTPPLIMTDPPPPGGVQATAYATLTSGGGIASITMDNVGAGYTFSPTFYIIPMPAVYQGSPIGGGAAPIDPWPAPGIVHPNNLPQGSIYQPNQSAGLGALLTSNALTGSGTITALGLLNAGAGYVTTAPAVTITGIGGSPTATTTLGPAPAVDRAWLQNRVG
jgi:hypothetical protein